MLRVECPSTLTDSHRWVWRGARQACSHVPLKRKPCVAPAGACPDATCMPRQVNDLSPLHQCAVFCVCCLSLCLQAPLVRSVKHLVTVCDTRLELNGGQGTPLDLQRVMLGPLQFFNRLYGHSVSATAAPQPMKIE